MEATYGPPLTSTRSAAPTFSRSYAEIICLEYRSIGFFTVVMEEIAGGTAMISLGQAAAFDAQLKEAKALAQCLKGERLPARYRGEISSTTK